MRKIPALALFTLATLATATGMYSQELAVKATVPFDFTVGDKVLPAGDYTITSSTPPVVLLKGTGNRVMSMVIGTTSSSDSAGGGRLVFERYGDLYFLRRVLTPSSSRLNVDIATGRIEKRARTREARLQTGQEVLVATR